MTDCDAIAAELRTLAEKATPGPWEADTLETEGGDGKYNAYAVYAIDQRDPALGRAILDTMNSDVQVIHTEGPDEDGFFDCWDETGRCDLAFIAAANPAAIVALLNERDALKARVKKLEAENERLSRAWEAKHKSQKADRNEAKEMFELAQRSAAERDSAIEAVNVLAEALNRSEHATNCRTNDRDHFEPIDEAVCNCHRAMLRHPAVVKNREPRHD